MGGRSTATRRCRGGEVYQAIGGTCLGEKTPTNSNESVCVCVCVVILWCFSFTLFVEVGREEKTRRVIEIDGKVIHNHYIKRSLNTR